MDNADAVRWDQFGDYYDWPTYSGETKGYLIASSARSGSHFLANLLFQTGQLGSPLEYLHPKHFKTWQEILGVPPKATLRAIARRRTGPSGWFGLKAHWPQFADLLDEATSAEAPRITHFIRLTREDYIAQAVSMEIARQSGAWISYHTAGAEEPQYDFQAIYLVCKNLQAEDAAWNSYFDEHQIVPHRLTYEDLVAAPEEAVRGILDFLSVPHDLRAVRTQDGPQRQMTQRNTQWCKRFRAEALDLGLITDESAMRVS